MTSTANTTKEVEQRLAAIKTWCDHALFGECELLLALDAIDQLSLAARMLLAGEAA